MTEEELNWYYTPIFEVSALRGHPYSFVFYEALGPSMSFWIVPGTITADD